jgi:small-conductance mechanosensitive channel
VKTRGLLYLGCELDDGDTVLIPNNSVLTMSVRPGHEPTGVELSATLPASVKAKDLRERLEKAITVSTRATPILRWQGYKDGQAEVLVSAIPNDPEDHEQLTEEILAALDEAGSEQ